MLLFAEPAAKKAFIDWYKAGDNKDIKGAYLEPENNPYIKEIVDFYNNAIAQGPAVEVTDGTD